MVIRSPELFCEILDAIVEDGYISQVATRVHVARTMIFQWIAQSEKNPDDFLTEWPVGSGEIFPLHEQIKRARALGRLGFDYFPDLEPTERDAVIRERLIESGLGDETLPARVTDARGRILGSGRVKPSNRRLPNFYETSARKAEAAIARRAEIDRQFAELLPPSLDTYRDDSDLLSDRPSDGLVTVDHGADGEPAPRRVLASVDPAAQMELGRRRRAEAMPEEIAVQPEPEDDAPEEARQSPRAAPELTPRQLAARQARARITQRIARGGAPMSDVERDLLANLEQAPAGLQRPTVQVAAAPRVDKSGLMDIPGETGAGTPAAGGIKMR